jgi:multidrug efflux pump subunit AcrB
MATVGLAAKYTILIVRVVKHTRLRRKSLVKFVLRLRLILVPTFALIRDVLPLVFATRTSTEMRQALSTAAFVGTLTAIMLDLSVTSVFYVAVEHMVMRRRRLVKQLDSLGTQLSPPQLIKD